MRRRNFGEVGWFLARKKMEKEGKESSPKGCLLPLGVDSRIWWCGCCSVCVSSLVWSPVRKSELFN
ncbi:hypothetical protein RchiOBHm_Chr1g0318851 [Rosa chinensis]|uniref:Uncharacterized protein n=1 Tax=Rosa chinensis TaxID=74649 RepID=A0A2P6S889_ROSCH|nr:hypothetical protein RchiOBHm_Chr1g0318851 [Rosa chinensis]